MSETNIRHFAIINEKGLHARASAKLVEVVERFNAEAVVRKDGLDAAGDSIMGLLMLAASKGTTIEVEGPGKLTVYNRVRLLNKEKQSQPYYLK